MCLHREQTKKKKSKPQSAFQTVRDPLPSSPSDSIRWRSQDKPEPECAPKSKHNLRSPVSQPHAAAFVHTHAGTLDEERMEIPRSQSWVRKQWRWNRASVRVERAVSGDFRSHAHTDRPLHTRTHRRVGGNVNRAMKGGVSYAAGATATAAVLGRFSLIRSADEGERRTSREEKGWWKKKQ